MTGYVIDRRSETDFPIDKLTNLPLDQFIITGDKCSDYSYPNVELKYPKDTGEFEIKNMFVAGSCNKIIKRKAYTGWPEACCHYENTRDGNIDLSLSNGDPYKQHTCDPKYRDYTQPACDKMMYDFCQDRDLNTQPGCRDWVVKASVRGDQYAKRILINYCKQNNGRNYDEKDICREWCRAMRQSTKDKYACDVLVKNFCDNNPQNSICDCYNVKDKTISIKTPKGLMPIPKKCMLHECKVSDKGKSPNDYMLYDDFNAECPKEVTVCNIEIGKEKLINSPEINIVVNNDCTIDRNTNITKTENTESKEEVDKPDEDFPSDLKEKKEEEENKENKENANKQGEDNKEESKKLDSATIAIIVIGGICCLIIIAVIVIIFIILFSRNNQQAAIMPYYI